MFIDSHCHLQHCYKKEHLLEETLRLAGNMTYFLNVSTNTEEILNIVRFSLPKNVFHAFGLYPEEAFQINTRKWEEFALAVKKYNPSVIGEIGLDFHHWGHDTLSLQEDLFRKQIELALNENLPVMVHSRDAFSDTFRILSDYSFLRPFVLHCFSYGPKEAEEFLKLGCVFSFAGNLTYPQAKEIQKVASIVPLDRILLETDSPYLSPFPVRGSRNNPANVKYTYEYLASLRKMDLEELADNVEKNFKRIFL
jgi:TatD DNase family protein